MKIHLAVALCCALLAAGCGGGSATQPATEQGAQDAVKAGLIATLDGDIGGVYNFMSQGCQDSSDREDVKSTLLLVKLFLGDSGLDINSSTINTSITSFDGSTARVATEYVGPAPEDDSGVEFGSDDVKVFYENGRWVADDCEFGDSTEVDAEATGDALADMGLAGSRAEPVPADIAVPIGSGYSISFNGLDLNAEATIKAQDGFVSDHGPNEQLVIASVTIGYEDRVEPAQANSVTITAVGPSSVAIDSWGCGNFDSALSNQAWEIFSGAVVAGDVCFVVPTDQVNGLVFRATVGFSDSAVFFDPSLSPASPSPVTGTTGPADGGDFSAARLAPTPKGEVADLGEGWTIKVLGFTPDASEIIASAADWNDPAPVGRTYSLVDVAVTYDGTEEPASLLSLSFFVVGNSNVAVHRNCNVSEIPNQLDKWGELYPGAAVSGQLCFAVPAGDLDSAVFYARATFFDDDPHVLALN